MKKALFIGNVIGALICFVIFAADPFINWLVDKSTLLMPFWVWGLVGFFLFEILWFVFRKHRAA